MCREILLGERQVPSELRSGGLCGCWPMLQILSLGFSRHHDAGSSMANQTRACAVLSCTIGEVDKNP